MSGIGRHNVSPAPPAGELSRSGIRLPHVAPSSSPARGARRPAWPRSPRPSAPTCWSRRATNSAPTPSSSIAEGTHFAQPALYCASLAHWKQAGSPAGAMLAGHSLGELAALVAGGALDAEEGLRLAVVRGRLMEEAGRGQPRRHARRRSAARRRRSASSPPSFGLDGRQRQRPRPAGPLRRRRGARRGPHAGSAPTAPRRSGCRSPAPSTRR